MNRLILVGLLAACGKGSPPPKLDCSNILSPELRAKYFANFELVDEAMGPGTGQCSVVPKVGDKTQSGRLTVSCRGKVGEDLAPAIADLKHDLPDLEEFPGIGRAALISHQFSLTSLYAWDDNSNCSVSLFLQSAIDSVGLTKDILAYYPTK
jgi:hypothetical protein